MPIIADFVGVDNVTLSGLTVPLTLHLAKPISDLDLIAFSRSVRPYPVERNADGSLTIGRALGWGMGALQMHAATALWKWAEEHGGLAFSSSVGYVWSDSSARMASMSWISTSRSKILRSAEDDTFVAGSPDFLIDIVYDPSQRALIKERMRDWLANGAQLAWIIDPHAAEVLVYRPSAEPQLLLRPDWVLAESVVPGFRLQTGKMWCEE